MKKLLFVLFAILAIQLRAQERNGIQFQNGLSWDQIKHKALIEHKYIFIDCYTTWCGPCKVMEQNIFTKPDVAQFFNKNFVNVKIQFDTTPKDDAEVKRFYKFATELQSNYKVASYPTYLFFKPDGLLVHVLVGATNTGKVFVTKASKALNPKTQYTFLKRTFNKGNRDSTMMLTLINAARQTDDQEFMKKVINTYLSTQVSLLTKRNLKLIIEATSKSSDPGFPILKDHGALVDSVNGFGATKKLIETIAFDELVLPSLRTNGKRTDYGGGMIVYSGDVVNQVHWDSLEMVLNHKYPAYAKDIFMKAKPTFYEFKKDWGNYCESVSIYVDQNTEHADLDLLNSYAWTVFSSTAEPTYLAKAITWSELTLKGNDKNVYYLHTYANLLYKAGDKDKAIMNMNKALALADNKQQIILELRSMKQGLKTSQH